jgi:hypothetical protein
MKGLYSETLPSKADSLIAKMILRDHKSTPNIETQANHQRARRKTYTNRKTQIVKHRESRDLKSE